ncbi:MAG: hypothetical protein Q9217_003422 [Psora testacea]
MENLKTAIEDNLDYLDGYEELPKSDQERVRKALEDGHIADEDWTGDPEMNRNGMNGYRTPTSKKKMREEKKEREITERDASISPSKPTTKKRGRVKREDDGEEVQDGEPAPKKGKAASKRVKAGDDEDSLRADQQPKTKGRKKPAKVKSEDGVKALEKRSRGKGRRASPGLKTEDADNEVKADTGSPPEKKSRKKATKIKTENADNEAATHEAPEQSGRNRVPKAKVDPDADYTGRNEGSHDKTVGLPSTKRARVPRKAALKKIKIEESEDDEPAAQNDANAARDETACDIKRAEEAAEEEVEPSEEEPQPRKGRKKAPKAAATGKSFSEPQNTVKTIKPKASYQQSVVQQSR